MKVLIVDDDLDMAVALRASLLAGGIEAHAADGGEGALLLLQDQPFDALVTDADMRPMDGRHLAARARELRPGLRVYFMSGHPEARERCSAGEKFIAKPFDPAALLKLLKENPSAP